MIKALDVVSQAGGVRKALVREIKGVIATDTISIDLAPAAKSKRPAILSGIEIAEEK